LRVEQGVEEGAQQVLRHPSYEAALADPQSLSVLVALAARADADSSLRPLLLKFLLPRHDLWLLAALHPKLQSGAWTITIPALTPEERAILAFGLPASDREPEGFSPIVLQWWAEDIERLIGEQREPAAFVSTLLQVHLPLVEEYQALGYPERAQILAQSLASFAEPVRSSLTPDLQKSLGEMQAIAAPRFILMDSPMSSSSAAASPPAPLPSVPLSPPGEGRSVSLEERVGIVEAMLEQAGALFTTQAKFDPLDDGRSVHVSGILFASSRGDRSYEFDVDTVANEVSSIVQDGKTMPYPMGFDAFLEWVRK
jgi:hypothetical protein